MTNKLVHTKGVLLLAFTSILAGCAVAMSGDARPPNPREWYFSDQFRVRRLENRPAPELNVASWVGKACTLKELRGRIVVLDFWAAWCSPCIAAMSVDKRIARDYADKGVTLIAIHDAARGWDEALRHVNQRQVQYSVALDAAVESERTATKYGLEAWPTYVVIDRQGIVRAAGVRPDFVEDVVQALLAETSDAAGGDAETFPVELFLGGPSRPEHLRAVEGKVLTELQGEAWIGVPPRTSIRSNAATVLHFWTPTCAASVRELDALRELQDAFRARNVRLIAVCDPVDWAAARQMAASRNWSVAAMCDGPAPEHGVSTRGATAVALGVLTVPATLVVDAAGTVRAAGIRADKALDVVERVLGSGSLPAAPAKEAHSK